LTKEGQEIFAGNLEGLVSSENILITFFDEEENI